jgi:pimeloyl-ACP methyl ester carboxylesterase
MSARRDLRGAISRESLGRRGHRTDWRLGGRRVVVLLFRARRSGAPADQKALKKLRAIGPPPYPAKSVFVERTVVNRMDGQMRLGILWKAGRALFGRPETSIFDLPNLVRGFGFTLDAMWAEGSKLNLLKLVPALKMPVVMFVGRRDHWVPPETSVAYFDALAAPSKRLVWFEFNRFRH